MDDVFGNSSGDTVVDTSLFSPARVATNCTKSDLNVDPTTYKDDLNDISDQVYKKLQQILGANQELNIKSKVSMHQQISCVSSIEDEFPSNLSNKEKLDLNQTQDLQIDQNSENHQLEHIQKLSELENEQENYLPDAYLDDIHKKQDNGRMLSNSTVKHYLDEFENGEKEKRKQDIIADDLKAEKWIKSLFSVTQAIDIKNSNNSEVTRNSINMQASTIPSQTTGCIKESPQNSVQPKQRTTITTPTMAARPIYQNLPIQVQKQQSYRYSSPQQPQAPTYMNVPPPRALRGDGMSSYQAHLNHSYIQLWPSGQRESLTEGERDPTRKQTCKQSRISSPGYVQMTSPFVRSPVSSIFTQLASSLATQAGHAPKTIFCPLCPRQFGHESTLANHIQRAHRSELETMIDSRPGDLALQCCPVCQARFFNTSILPKHLTDCHKDCIIQLLEKHKCITSNSKGIMCPFCIKCVPFGINGEHMMMFHLQQYHQVLFSDMITKTFQMRKNNSSEILRESGATNTPELSGKMGNLLVVSDSKRKLEDVEKEEEIWSSQQHQFKKITGVSIEKKITKTPRPYQKPEPRRSVSKGILRRDKTPSDRPNVKRELRFSVPHVTQEKLYFPESPDPLTPDYDDRLDLNTFSYPETIKELNGSRNASKMDDIITEEFVDMNQHTSRKRRRIGISIRTKNIFKCKDKENLEDKCEIIEPQVIYATSNTRSFRRPKPISPPKVPITSKQQSNGSPCASKLHSTTLESERHSNTGKNYLNNTKDVQIRSNDSGQIERNEINIESRESCPFSSLKLFSPLRLFRCISCRSKFCDNDSLFLHISQQHRGIFSLLRPQFGCGVCSAKFYENKQLVKHCLQHHTSLLEIRGPCLEENLDIFARGASGNQSRKIANHIRNSKQVTSL